MEEDQSPQRKRGLNNEESARSLNSIRKKTRNTLKSLKQSTVKSLAESQRGGASIEEVLLDSSADVNYAAIKKEDTVVLIEEKQTVDLSKYRLEKKPEKGAGVSLFVAAKRWFNRYRQIFTLVTILNAVALSNRGWSWGKENSGSIGLFLVLMAILTRSELALRFLYYGVAKIVRYTPVHFRHFTVNNLVHLGGFHSSLSLAGITWLLYVVQSTWSTNPEVIRDFGIFTCATLIFSAIAAFPLVRFYYHNLFENVHRYSGWMSLALIWVFVILSDTYQPVDGSYGDSYKLFHRANFYLTLLILILIVTPWLTVRKIPVDTIILSSKNVLIRMPNCIQAGLLGRVSRTLLGEWHAFGIVSRKPGHSDNCHYFLVTVLGDWTGDLLLDPPTELYTRELKFTGLPILVNLYPKGLIVCTGSGIGVTLSPILQDCQWTVLWVGKNFRKTYGDILMDMCRPLCDRGQLVMFDTAEHGRPDLAKLIPVLYKAAKAEVVFITSNPAGTNEIQGICDANGFPAFGPIWDS